MPYSETKVYYDGSHYIAIPHEPQPWKRKKTNLKTNKQKPKTQELFEKFYLENLDKPKRERNEIITEELTKIVGNKQAKKIIRVNNERIKRNAIVRKTRLARKVNLQEWHYFCTFTYDDNKLTEEEFKKKLSDCFKKLAYRKKWKYVGVWERSPINKRLHFHGLFYTPAMVGELKETKDYSTKKHQMQITLQNTYFLERFGRNDFKQIESDVHINESKNYLMKYIEKSGEKIVYSKGLYTYFISDILDDDVVCTIGIEDRKLLLFDNFTCLKNGEYIGEVSKATIEKMHRIN